MLFTCYEVLCEFAQNKKKTIIIILTIKKMIMHNILFISTTSHRERERERGIFILRSTLSTRERRLTRRLYTAARYIVPFAACEEPWRRAYFQLPQRAGDDAISRRSKCSLVVARVRRSSGLHTHTHTRSYSIYNRGKNFYFPQFGIKPNRTLRALFNHPETQFVPPHH